MGLIWLVMLFLLAGNVAVARANNCWQTSVSIHYTVGPSTVTVTQSDANSVMNEVLNHGKGQLSCSGLTLKLINVTITTPGNLYSIKGLFGVVYGNMDSSQKSAAQTCLANAVIFNDIVLRPDYYTSPLKGSYWADRASLTNYQDATCCFNGMIPSNGVCVSPAASPSSTVLFLSSTSIVSTSAPATTAVLPQPSSHSPSSVLSSPSSSPSASPSPSPFVSPSPSPVPPVTVYSTVNITSCLTASQTSKTLGSYSNDMVPTTSRSRSKSPSATSSATPSATSSATPSATSSAAPSVTSSATSSDTSSDVPSASSSDVPSAPSSAATSATSSSVPSDPSSDVSSSTSSAAPSAASSAVPSPSSSAATSATSSGVPYTSSSAAPSATSSAAPSSTSSAVPSATSSAVPSATSSATPSATLSAAPSATSSATPSSTSSAASPAILSAALSADFYAVPSATSSAAPSADFYAVPSATSSATPSVTSTAVPSANFYAASLPDFYAFPSPTSSTSPSATSFVASLTFTSPSATPPLALIPSSTCATTTTFINHFLSSSTSAILIGTSNSNTTTPYNFPFARRFRRMLPQDISSSQRTMTPSSSTSATSTTSVNPVGTTTIWVTSYINSCESPTTTIAMTSTTATSTTTAIAISTSSTAVVASTTPAYQSTTSARTTAQSTTTQPTTQPTTQKTTELTTLPPTTTEKPTTPPKPPTTFPMPPTTPPKPTTTPVFLDLVNFVSRQRVNLGESIQLVCGVRGTAPINKMTWYRNNEEISENVEQTQTGLNHTIKLVLKDVMTPQAGDYTCEVVSSIKTLTESLNLEVQVSKQLEMAISLKNKEYHSDLSNASSPRYKALSEEFTQQATTEFRSNKDFQRIEVIGFKRGSVIVDFIVFMSQVLSKPQDDPPDLVKEANNFMIEHVKQFGSFGNYSVSPDSLFLKAIPPPPINIKNKDKGIKYIELQWERPVNWESYQITKYILKYKKSEDPVFERIEVDSNVFVKKIENLEKNTKYDFELYSKNAVGESVTPSSYSDATLSITPVIANDGQVFTFKKGETAVIYCIGSSETRPNKVEWTSKPSSGKDDRNETSNTRNIYKMFEKVEETNAGIYKCRTSLKDAVGSGSVTLIVIVPVEVKLNATLNETFTEDLKNENTTKYKRLKIKFEKELSKLYVNLTGFVRVEVIGFTNGSVKVKFRIIAEVKIVEPKQLNQPTKTKVDITKRIIEKVKTSGGNIGGGVFIKQNSVKSDAPPPSPLNLRVTDIHETKAHLRWLKPEDADAFSIHSYVIKLKKFGQEWQEKITTQHIQLDSRIDELEDDTGYTAKVFARGNGGDGLDSRQQEFKTKEVEWNLTWLWICLALFIVLGIFILLVYHYKKKQRVDRRYDANGNRAGRRRASIPCNGDPKNVTIYSYRNDAFALSSMDFESLGLMPGKWWEIPRAILTLGDTLGSGQFGMVKKGVLELDNGPVTCAVKMLKNSAGEEEARDLMNELDIMAGVGTHENLVNLIGACTYDGPFLIALEFAEGGSLESYIRTNVMPVGDGREASSLSDQEKLEIGLDIAKGMQHLAHVKCVHRDLAARNVLLTRDHRAKIADFGLSRDVYERGFYEKQSQGKLPVRWMAPEAIQQMIFTTKGDVWSYGVVLWEIESGGKLPYAGLGMLELIDYLKKGQRLVRPSRCLEVLYNVMLHCWHMDPNKRPTFDNICTNMEELLFQSNMSPQIEVPPPRYELHPHFGNQ